jgi:hypothetical protein
VLTAKQGCLGKISSGCPHTALPTQNRRVASMRNFIVEFPAFGTWHSMKIRISAMIESPQMGSEMLQSPEARTPVDPRPNAFLTQINISPRTFALIEASC